MLTPFSNIKKAYLQILKNLAQFSADPLFSNIKKEYLPISKYPFDTNNFKGDNLRKDHYTNNSHKNHYTN